MVELPTWFPPILVVYGIAVGFMGGYEWRRLLREWPSLWAKISGSTETVIGSLTFTERAHSDGRGTIFSLDVDAVGGVKFNARAARNPLLVTDGERCRVLDTLLRKVRAAAREGQRWAD